MKCALPNPHFSRHGGIRSVPIALLRSVSLLVCLLGASWALALDESATDGEAAPNSGGLESLRGRSELDENPNAEAMKSYFKDRSPIERNYVHQPPLIPHSIRDYHVDLRSNKCLSCHSWKYAAEAGATKISSTHFETRDGITLSDVYPGRYFCLQCHVPQTDTAPLVDNSFAPVDSLAH